MSQRSDGGPAFPCAFSEYVGKNEFGDPRYNNVQSGGMTLRDYFAAKAMQALIASRFVDFEDGQYTESVAAKSAYEMADAMLKARQE